jgi:hypothetical protein
MCLADKFRVPRENMKHLMRRIVAESAVDEKLC